MFVVVRSLFWLTVAYMVIKPGVDFPDDNALSQQAMAAGSRVVAEQINRNVLSVRNISEQTATASEETAASSVELARLGSHLKTLVGRFRV